MQKIASLLLILKTPEIRSKVLFTLGVLIVVRVLASIPTPGVDATALQTLAAQNGVFGFLNIFSGGTLSNLALIAVGLGAYINASVLFQILSTVIPRLEELSKEGVRGQRVITQLTRIVTVPLAALQAFGIYTGLKQAGASSGVSIFPNMTTLSLIALIVSLTAGAMLLMWLGELIAESGVGNGISFLIMATILAGIPHTLVQTIQSQNLNFLSYIAIAAVALVIFTGVVIINEATRNIPIQYARKAQSQTNVQRSTYLPIKINTAGVMPAIFALAILIFPILISTILENAKNPAIATRAVSVNNFFNDQVHYAVLYFLLVIIFTFFYTFIVFKPKDVADNLRKQGGYIPGIRPGEQTEQYLTNILLKLTVPGAIFLALIVVFPFVMQGYTHVSTLSIGGTSILIVIGVIIQTMKDIRAMLVTRSYDRFLDI